MTGTQIVPMLLDALVVDADVVARDTFRLWQFGYDALSSYASPEPLAFDRTGVPAEPGAYLHWTLPVALRQGTQDPATGEVTYPLVPNRWLVVRFSGTSARTATGWVVESDCPYSAVARQAGYDLARSSAYLVEPGTVSAWRASSDPYRNGVTLDPASADPLVANIGLAFPLDGWAERAATVPLFLTAAAPANPLFSTYTAHNRGVFSFYDDLAGIDEDTLGYAVVGWYSDPAAGDGLYAGYAESVAWTRTPAEPDGNDPLVQVENGGVLGVGLGNTAEDALLALVAQQLTAKGYPTTALPLLRGLLYDLLPVLNQPNGDALVQQAVERAWFGARPGGYTWTVAPPPATGDGTQPAFVTPGWLATLNADQAALDLRLGELYAAQWAMNAMWLKNGVLPTYFPSAPDDAPAQGDVTAQLDPDTPGTVGATLLDAIEAVLAAAALVPQPADGVADPAQAYAAGIAAFAEAKGLPEGATLKAVPAPSFWQPGNPVVMLSGVTPPSGAETDDPPPVRAPGDVVTALTVGTASFAAASVPAPPGAAALPGGVAALVAEAYLLDPANAAALAAAAGADVTAVRAAMTAHDPASYTGTLPALLRAWSQPWEPLLMEWSVRYIDVPYDATPSAWTFDGDDYRLTDTAAVTGVTDESGQQVVGISLLSQHTQAVFADRLASFARSYGEDGALDQLASWLGAVDGWKFLAQELTGFGDLLALRDGRAFRRPTAADTVGAAGYHAADLIGYTDADTGSAYSIPARYRGHVTTAPFLPPDEPAFRGVRAGQIWFDDLIVYDKFGRVLQVVAPPGITGLHDAKNFPVALDASMVPDTALVPGVVSVAQLPPRLLQGARLDVTLLDGATGEPFAPGTPGANPVGGWVLPSHLDAGLLLYDPAGRALGEYRTTVGPDGSRAGAWSPPPGSATVAALADVTAAAPLVGGLASSAALATGPAFDAFLQVIDATLWTVDPLGARADQSLSVLVGRPLALVRLRVALTLDGPALLDPSWAATIHPPAAAFTAYEIPVRLGDQAMRDDGLVGYFAGGTFEAFSSVVAPAAGQSFVSQIGPPPAGTDYVHVTPGGYVDVVALLDPRAGVRATTGLLPDTVVAVPQEFVGPALAGLEVTFRVGPALTTTGATPVAAGAVAAFPQAVAYPMPAERAGTWSWWQPVADGWQGYALTDLPSDAQFTGGGAEVRDGVLRLDLDRT